MYIFEFTHTLDKEDLSDIWQGVMPKISLKAEEQSSSITHFLTNNEILLGKDITKEIRWMVFKVKQRAKYSYQQLLNRSLGVDELVVEEQDTAEVKYSYNWPYDFFSLVELARIDTGVQIGGEIPVTPPALNIDPVEQGEVAEMDGGEPLQVGEEYQPADNDKVQSQDPAQTSGLGNIPII